MTKQALIGFRVPLDSTCYYCISQVGEENVGSSLNNSIWLVTTFSVLKYITSFIVMMESVEMSAEFAPLVADSVVAVISGVITWQTRRDSLSRD